MSSTGGSPKVKETAQERTLDQQSVADFQDYERRFKPIVRDFASRLQGTPGQYGRAAGTGAGDVVAGFAGADQAVARRSAAGGNGIRALTAFSKNARRRGQALGLATGRAVQGVDDTRIAGLKKLASFGRGQADNNLLGLESSAQNAASSAIADTETKINRDNLIEEGIGTLAGAGAATGFHKLGSRTPKSGSTVDFSGWTPNGFEVPDLSAAAGI